MQSRQRISAALPHACPHDCLSHVDECVRHSILSHHHSGSAAPARHGDCNLLRMHRFGKNSLQETTRDFYKSVRGMSSDATCSAAESIVARDSESITYAEGGTFFPLGVWKQQGFDPDAIERGNAPEDRKEHRILGPTFRVPLTTITREVKRGFERVSKKAKVGNGKAGDDDETSARAAARAATVEPDRLAIEDGVADDEPSVSSESSSSSSSSNSSSSSKRKGRKSKKGKKSKKSKKDKKKSKKAKKGKKSNKEESAGERKARLQLEKVKAKEAEKRASDEVKVATAVLNKATWLIGNLARGSTSCSVLVSAVCAQHFDFTRRSGPAASLTHAHCSGSAASPSYMGTLQRLGRFAQTASTHQRCPLVHCSESAKRLRRFG
jgi:hypothetical protein